MFNNDHTLWMGCLNEYMDAGFIGDAFRKMGEEVVSVKVVYDKYTGKRASYCFVEFPDRDAARRCMLNVNGKVVPDSRPTITFKLSFAMNPMNPTVEHSLIASNLPNEVTDAELFNLFGRRYITCRGARVFTNQNGTSRGMGIVRFGSQTEQQRALLELNRWPIYGRPMALKIAQDRNRHGQYRHEGSKYDPAAYYPKYHDFYNSSSWQMYDYVDKHSINASQSSRMQATVVAPINIDPNLLPEPYVLEPDIALENEKFINENDSWYECLEKSRWHFINSASVLENDLL